MTRRILCTLVSLLFLLQLSAQRVLPKPNPQRLVNDAAGLLTPDQVASLERKLVAYDDTTSNQIAIVTVPSLNGLEPVDYATELGREWGIGGREFNNGVIVLISTGQDGEKRKVFIAPGYGLEGALPDIICKRIVEAEMIPNLKAGNYYRAIDEATDAIIKAAAGEYKAPEGYNKRGEEGEGVPVFFIILIVLLVLFVISRGGRGGGGGGGMMSRRGYRGWNSGPPVIFFPGGGGGSGGGWSGGGGGGFGGFGGGSFGGGGAGGDW
ncbi:TPM domain-containing protein [Flavihumibacter rivuli]|uniref:TPM domain-containing protein n=1 Tax=Flavihumibacter rivuli TaxID=2838156 RepID=UPI001BDEF125|nr:TPM domain-containing protein [Flavihumibacter rivuli]